MPSKSHAIVLLILLIEFQPLFISYRYIYKASIWSENMQVIWPQTEKRKLIFQTLSDSSDFQTKLISGVFFFRLSAERAQLYLIILGIRWKKMSEEELLWPRYPFKKANYIKQFFHNKKRWQTRRFWIIFWQMFYMIYFWLTAVEKLRVEKKVK